MTWSSGRILHMLHERHAAPEWAFFAELSNGTGARRDRSFDAFALNLYPSKLFRSVVYEVKVSRADFARELADPAKRQAAEVVSGEFWFAVPAGLVRVDEVPEGCGLLEATDDGLKQRRLPAQRVVKDWPPEFVAAIARRSADPNPGAPAAVWQFAGRPLTLADLRRVAEKLALTPNSAELRRAHAAGRAEERAEREPHYRNLVRINDYLAERFGYFRVRDISTLARALDELARGGAGGKAPEIATRAREILRLCAEGE